MKDDISNDRIIKSECRCNDCSCESSKDDPFIKLGSKDSAIIFRDGGDDNFSVEISLPDYKDEDIVSSTSALISIIAMRISDDDFVQEQYEWLDNKLKIVNSEEEG